MAWCVEHKAWFTGSQNSVICLKKGDRVNFFTELKELNKNIVAKYVSK